MNITNKNPITSASDFEVGEYYERRNGVIIKLVEYQEGSPYPWLCDMGHVYTDDGHFTDTNEENACDLVYKICNEVDEESSAEYSFLRAKNTGRPWSKVDDIALAAFTAIIGKHPALTATAQETATIANQKAIGAYDYAREFLSERENRDENGNFN